MASPFSGVGDSSIDGIKAAAKSSGLVPPLQDTNDYDPPPGGGGYHLTKNAVDWSNGGNAGTPQMDAFASWVAKNYGPYSLEIIHVNQDGSGVYWKMGKQVAASFYSSVLYQHHNHVHWAITNPGLTAAGSPTSSAGSAASSSSSSAASSSSAGSGILGSLFAPVVEFVIEAGMVGAGLGLLLFGLVLAFKVPVGGIAKGAGVAALAAT